jgi:hypothetical protein
MSTADSLNSGRKINYGFGLVPGVYNGRKTVSHTGGIPGFATAATYVPDDSLSIVVYTNFDGVSPQALVQNLLRVAYGEAPAGERSSAAGCCVGCSVASAAVAMRSSAPLLQLPGGRALLIKLLRTEPVHGTGPGPEANEMRYWHYEFGVAFDPALRLTFTMDAGKATKVTLLQGGASFDGFRVP